MFCPKCGKADQQPETFCRQCGLFLPDLSKPVKAGQTPEQHNRANIALSSITILTSFTLAILLYLMLAFRPDTHPLIYVTAGLLIAMGAWHIQTLWRSILLRKYIKRQRPADQLVIDGSSAADKLLTEPDFESAVPMSVTDRTTKQLSEQRRN